MTQFQVRLNQILLKKHLRGIDVDKLSRQSGDSVKVTRSDMSYYLSGKYVPKKEKLEALARILEVEPSWLLGNEESEQGAEQERMQPAAKDELLQELIDVFARLPIRSKIDLLHYAYSLNDKSQQN